MWWRAGACWPVVLLISIVGCRGTAGYPLDGYEHTGIGRLESARRVQEGIDPGDKQPRGALLRMEQVVPRLLDRRDLELPSPDPVFTAEVVALLGGNADRYSIAVLDLSDRDAPLYAEHRAAELYNPGSVGKLAVAMAWFQQLADLYSEDTQARWRLLKDTSVVASDVVVSDHHTVRRWDRQAQRLIRRSLQPADTGTLLEFMDWMLSASANAAASVLIKQGLLLRHFGNGYPAGPEVERQYFQQTPGAELTRSLIGFLHDPVARSGLDPERFRQGSFFTATGKRLVAGTSSYASARELLRYLLRLEQGRIVDEFSSTEIKRLLYSTERRIRYASSPALPEAAVYFKSGSLFECAPEPDFVCLQYHGNVKNYMNSVAIVESPAGAPRFYYMVALMSNVLRKNSAVDHQTLATRIQRLIEKRHAGTAARQLSQAPS
ncbi:MAG: hypothetical protein A3H91_12900 [Gammaproteobacteria bacterium RIFCSPLOWO2_02_FULL_61_13]|nr:MAG: hypothetical protein A3H91_12900 [Gammaproteobacteria bacterium RIFCSPLOWO2_02_FULL_61_13]